MPPFTDFTPLSSRQRHPQRLRALVLSPLIVLPLSLGGWSCSERGPEPVALPPADPAAGAITELTGWVGGTSEITVTDLDNDGLRDLVLTSHAMNRVQPFRQRPEGGFAPLPPLEGVGFHPNGVAPFRDARGEPVLLQSAETRDTLRIYRFKPKGVLKPQAEMTFEGEIPAPRPRLTLPLGATGRPDSLLVLSRGKPSLTIYHGFDASEATYSEQHTLWRPEQTKAGQIRSPLAVRLRAGADPEVVFVDTLVRGLRVLRFDDNGAPFMEDLFMSEREFRPALVAAAGNDPDAAQTLFLFGTNDAPLQILTPDPDGSFRVRNLPMPVDFNHDVAVIEDAGEPPVLVVARQEALVLLRFPDGFDGRPTWSQIDKDLRVGQLVLEAADLNGDGHTDLVLDNSGNRDIPLLILYGPVWDHAAGLAEYYEDADRFQRLVRPDEVPRIPRGSSPPTPDIPGLELDR